MSFKCLDHSLKADVLILLQQQGEEVSCRAHETVTQNIQLVIILWGAGKGVKFHVKRGPCELRTIWYCHQYVIICGSWSA